MINTEIGSRGDFLTGFAKRDKSSSKPPKKLHVRSITNQPQPPEQDQTKQTRRAILRLGSGIVGVGAGFLVAEKLGILSQIFKETSERDTGIKLENLKLNTQDGKELKNNVSYRVGKFEFEKQATKYDLFLNPQPVIRLAENCGVNNVAENFRVILAEQYATPNRQGQLEVSEAGSISNGSLITVFIGLDTLFAKATKELDQKYEINAKSIISAEVNLFNLLLNQTLTRIVCGSTMASLLIGSGSHLQEMGDQANQKITKLVDDYTKQILNGQTDLLLIALPSSRNIF